MQKHQYRCLCCDGDAGVKRKSIDIDAYALFEVLKMQNWTDMPHRIVRTEMTKRGINYAELVERFARIGIVENERSLRNKVARSTFSATFMLQCMVAMDMMVLDLNGYELPRPAGSIIAGE